MKQILIYAAIVAAAGYAGYWYGCRKSCHSY